MPDPLRIARIITRLNIGGPAIQALTLSARLDAHGFETLLIHGVADPSEGDMRSILATPQLQRVCVEDLQRSIRPYRDLRALTRIYRLLSDFKPDIVHTHMAKAGTLGRLAALAYNRTGGHRKPTRIIHTYHGHVFDGYFRPGVSSAFIAIERQLARGSDAIVAISPRIKDEIVARYQVGTREQVRVVPLGFDLGPFAAIDASAQKAARLELGLSPDASVVTTVGRLTQIKRQDLFLDMAGKIAATHPGARLLIVGDGALRGTLEAQASALGLEGRTEFLGWRSDLAAHLCCDGRLRADVGQRGHSGSAHRSDGSRRGVREHRRRRRTRCYPRRVLRSRRAGRKYRSPGGCGVETSSGQRPTHQNGRLRQSLRSRAIRF